MKLSNLIGGCVGLFILLVLVRLGHFVCDWSPNTLQSTPLLLIVVSDVVVGAFVVGIVVAFIALGIHLHKSFEKAMGL